LFDDLFLGSNAVAPRVQRSIIPLSMILLLIAKLSTPSVYGEGEPILMAHWPLDDATGTAALDSSGGANDGQLINMNVEGCWVEGVHGGALGLDGVNDYVGVPHRSDLQFQGNFSIALWYRPSRLNPFAGDYFIDKSIGIDKGSYILRMNPNNQLELLTNATGYSDSWKAAVTTNFSPSVGVWTHIAVVKDGQSATFYQDGVKLETDGATLDLALFPNDEELRIGGEGGRSIDGAIDDVRLYQGILTADEVLGLAKAPRLEGVELSDLDKLNNIDPSLFTNDTAISAVLKGVEGYVQSVQMAEDDRFVVNLHSYWRPPLGDYDGSTSLSFELVPGDGERDVWVIVTNQAGVSYPPVSAKITLDTMAPTVTLTTDSPNPTCLLYTSPSPRD